MIASVAAILHNRLKTNAAGTVFVCTFDNHVNRTQIEISCFATHHKFQLSWCLIAGLFVCVKCKAVNNNRREGRRRRANNINNTQSESFVWKCRKNLFSKNIGFFCRSFLICRYIIIISVLSQFGNYTHFNKKTGVFEFEPNLDIIQINNPEFKFVLK